MICLDDTDVLEAWSNVDAVIDYDISGLVTSTFKRLSTGTLGNAANVVIYTANAPVAIVAVIFTNTGGSVATVNFKLDPANGGNDKFLLPVAVSLNVGSSLIYDGQKFTVMDTAGQLLSNFPLPTVPVPLTVDKGGTGLVAITDHGIVLGSGIGAVTPMAVLAAGEIVYGVTGADPAALATVAVGQVLISGGVGVAPSWSAAPTISDKINLTGGQIAFPATAVPSGDPNTIDDYEEGEWTPVYEGSTGSIGATAYGTRHAEYQKVGNVVTIWCYLVLTNNGDWTGEVQMAGIPFVCGAGLFASNAAALAEITFNGVPSSYIADQRAFLQIQITRTGANVDGLVCAGVSNDARFWLTLAYQV